MQTPLRILGIDPGTRSVGYGIIEVHANQMKHIASGCIRAKGDSISVRLVQIHQQLQDVIREYQPAMAAVETVFAGENIKTAIAIGEARGVAVLSAAELGVEVCGYEPALVKRAVAGSGRAGKEQIQHMVKTLLNLPVLPPTDHEADALALAITHHQHLRSPLFALKSAPRRGRQSPRKR